MKRSTALVWMALVFAVPSQSQDWPTWRFDARRGASTPEDLPAELHLQWSRQLAAPAPAWPPDQTNLLFDESFEPVAAEGLLFVPSNVNDNVTAFDVETGEERWAFYADGPVRFAPAFGNGRLYFVSDDGCLYCLEAQTGNLLWKFQGAPENRQVLGNQRLISAWPSRGAPLLDGDTVYFTAGIWPFMGIFVHALNAETGEVLWTNSGSGSNYITQPHNSPAFAGIAPQGYLALSGDTLLVAGGRTIPAAFDRKTGALRYFDANPGKGTGGYMVAAGEGWFLNHGAIYDLKGGNLIESGEDRIDLPVISDEVTYTVSNGRVVARPISIREEKGINRRGEAETKIVAWGKPLWEVEFGITLTRVHLKAGSRLVASASDGTVAAFDLPTENNPALLTWSGKVEGEPWSLIAADGRLFVVTRQGGLYCFGGEKVEPKTLIADSPNLSSVGNAENTTEADAILDLAGVREGYVLVLGLGSGHLAEDLVKQSELHVVVVDPNATRVNEFRRRMTEAGLYGRKVAAIAADPLEAGLPPYFANLIVLESLTPESASTTEFFRTVYHSLRPYGGVACLRPQPEQSVSLRKRVEEASLENPVVEEREGWFLLKRPGPLPDAAPWTHHYGDSSNTLVSKDSRVKAPLGLLWFGGPSNQGILPRHGHGPCEQIVGGRLFIEGPDMLRAVDVYTGRLLWEKSLPGVGSKYDETEHIPGANAIGGNYVTLEDGVYIIHGDGCLRLDPATGEILQRFTVNSPTDAQAMEPWSFLNVRDDILLAGTMATAFETDVEFLPEEFRKLSDQQKSEVSEWVGKLTGQPLDPNQFDQVIAALTHLLGNPQLIEKLPPNAVEEEAMRAARKRVEGYRGANPASASAAFELKKLNRELMVCYIPEIRPRTVKVGGWVGSGVSSKRLVAMNRTTGEVLWSREAKHGFLHNSIILGGGKVFCIDRLPEMVVQALSRRGRESGDDAEILALDANTGEPIWMKDSEVFGTWLSYSEDRDILVQAARASRDMLPEPNHRMIAYRGSSGELLWDRQGEYGGPIMLHGDTILTQESALSLLTGEGINRANPLTGAVEPWSFKRNHGCNSAIASQCLLTFRSAAAGFFDLENDGGTGNLGGFRSGCTSNLIPADGVLNAPDYTRTCICSYQIQTSLAMVHMPEAEMWTFNTVALGNERIRNLGLNLGAPGDRVADDGVLWLDFPSVGGPSPEVPVRALPDGIQWFRQHASLLEGEGPEWVQSSGVEGLANLKIQLTAEKVEPKPYTVRLHFSEPKDLTPGERVFDVAVQGTPVITGLDVAREAGGPRRGIVKEIKGVQAAGELSLAMANSGSSETFGPVLSGVEILAEGW